MLFENLKRETASLHDAAAGTNRLMSPDITAAEYLEVLVLMQSMYRGMEDALWSSGHEGLCSFMEDRRRLPALNLDIDGVCSHFNLRQDHTVLEVLPPTLPTESDWIGALYVLEGSRLGGQLMAKHLQEVFGFPDGVGTSFFFGFGRETMRRWQEFKSFVSGLGDSVDQQSAINGAKATFHWFINSFPVSAARP